MKKLLLILLCVPMIGFGWNGHLLQYYLLPLSIYLSHLRSNPKCTIFHWDVLFYIIDSIKETAVENELFKSKSGGLFDWLKSLNSSRPPSETSNWNSIYNFHLLRYYEVRNVYNK